MLRVCHRPSFHSDYWGLAVQPPFIETDHFAGAAIDAVRLPCKEPSLALKRLESSRRQLKSPESPPYRVLRRAQQFPR